MQRRSQGRQGGMMLLEALIGILIFAIGILALVGMQARSIGQVSDSKYRVDAAFLANELISQIWVDRTNLGLYAYPGGSAAGLNAWLQKVNTTLPNASGANAPTVAVDAGTGQVTVTVRWQAPRATTVSNHMALAIIANP